MSVLEDNFSRSSEEEKEVEEEKAGEEEREEVGIEKEREVDIEEEGDNNKSFLIKKVVSNYAQLRM
ncbi:hypothetical protein ABG067_009372, partial [Albugo candida]